MPDTISWLHISDLHTNPTKTGWDAERVIRTLVEDLKVLQSKHGLHPDFIFFTGDLAYGQIGTAPGESLADQFLLGQKFLESVRNAFNPPISIENVFLVPGNHDIDRDTVTAPATTWLDRDADPDQVNEMIRANGRQWRLYMERLDRYRGFLQTQGYTHLLTDADRMVYTAQSDRSVRTVITCIMVGDDCHLRTAKVAVAAIMTLPLAWAPVMERQAA